MTGKIRVLMADDSSVVRRILTQVISDSGSCEVVFAGKNGKEAVDNLEVAKPDVVVLDVEMPVMDGIETVEAIRKKSARIPIVMCSSLTCAGGTATLEALAHGANDYVAKPAGTGHMDRALDQLKAELLPKLISWGEQHRRKTRPAFTPSKRPVATKQSQVTKASGPAEIVVIGVSTGGPNALADLLPALPKTLPVPVLIVQHMPPVFTGLLADRLNKTCPLEVREATKETPLRPGTIWIAPGDFHLVAAKRGAMNVLTTNKDPHENSCRPAVDVLFRSAAKVFGGKTLAVMLTGMGSDGLDGCKSVYHAGGRILVQDEESSTVWGMPRVVAEAGIATKILPLNKIANEIALNVQGSNTSKILATSMTT